MRLCFDPILHYDGWENDYLELFNKVKSSLNLDQVFDITVGVFRMSNDYFNRIRKSKPSSDLFYENYSNCDEKKILDSKKQREINQLVSKFFFDHFNKNKIYFWN